MWNLLKLELKSSRFKWANLIVILIIIFKTVTIYLFKDSELDPIFEIYSLVTVFIYFSLSDIQMEETDIIMNSVPISKKNMVLSKYIALLLGFMITTFYTLIYFWALNALNLYKIDGLTLNHILISFTIFIFQISLLLPLFHYFTLKWFVFCELIIFVIFNSIVKSNTVKIERLLLGKNTILFFLIPVAILIISILISFHNYNKREFVRR